ncbi:MAG: TonB-dependent receptor domain-containing protein [Candidatus Aminicenantia bacterium]
MTYLIRILTILLLLVTLISAQNKGEIEGYVKDSQTETPLMGVNIIIEGTQIRTTTNGNGYFRIINLPPGVYKITTQLIGYQSISKKVLIKGDSKVKLLLSLDVFRANEEIEVTAKLNDTLDLTAPVSVINEKEIRRSNPTTTAEALKSILGVFTVRPGGWGIKAVIQGMKDDRILVLIDGSRVNQACPMGMDACTATIDPDQIDYIEVIKGPHSVLHGSGNFGGIINIVTKKPEISGAGEFQTYGNLNLTYNSVSSGKKGGLNFGGKYRTVDFLIGAVGSSYKDYRIPTGIVENSGFKDTSYNFKIGYLLPNKHRLQFSTDRYIGKDIGYPGGFTIIPNEKRSLSSLSYSASNLSENFTSFSIKLYAQNIYHDAVTTPPGENFSHKEEASSNTYGTTAKGGFILGRKSFLTVGMDFSLWKMRASRYDIDDETTSPLEILPDSYISYFGVFGQNKIEITPKLNITLGGRVDIASSDAQISTDSQIDSQKSGSSDKFFSGNLNLLYKLSNNINLTASIGKASKVANPTERYFSATMKDGYYYIGTPSLRPEKNLSIQGGIRRTNANLKWSISFFQNKLTDLISAKIDPGAEPPFAGLMGVKRYVNIGKAIIRGLESDFGIKLTKRVSLYGNLAYTWGKDEITGEPLPQIPPLESRVKLRYNDSKERFWAELSGRFVAEQKRAAISAGETKTPGFSVFNFRGEIKLTNTFTFNFGVENIFNKAHKEHLNLAYIPEPGRNFYIGLKIGWRLSESDKLRREEKTENKKTQVIILNVEGMHCERFVNTVQTTLKKVKGVISAEVSLKNNSAVVEIWKDLVSVNQLIKAVEEAGYKVTLFKTPLQVIILNVEGIDCQFCANTVQITLKKIKGVISAEVNLKEKKVVIEIWKDVVSIDQLIKTIEELGYRVTLDKTYLKKSD